MENLVITTVHLSTIKVGDTVEKNGKFITVGKKYVKYDSFFGYSFQGDASSQYITKIQFAVPTSKGIVLR